MQVPSAAAASGPHDGLLGDPTPPLHALTHYAGKLHLNVKTFHDPAAGSRIRQAHVLNEMRRFQNW